MTLLETLPGRNVSGPVAFSCTQADSGVLPKVQQRALGKVSLKALSQFLSAGLSWLQHLTSLQHLCRDVNAKRPFENMSV